MAYTDIDDPSAYFQTTLYTGTGSNRSVTNGGNSDLQPDWIWIKNRTDGHYHNLHDSVRGVNLKLRTGGVAGETANSSSGYVSAFSSDGFSVVAGSSNAEEVNTNNDNYVAWQWKAGTSFTNDASGTSIGSIDSAGSVNTDAGFSIVSFTSTGSTSTVAHALGVKPDLYIIKKRAGDGGWFTFFTIVDGSLDYLLLHNTNAKVDVSLSAPTSTVFSTDNGSSGETMICYAFASKQGYSKFGSYKGNGNADGTFVYTGFKPAFIITKYSSGTGQNWQMYDNKRNPHNFVDTVLFPNSGADEEAYDKYDFLSNGFKARAANTGTNVSGGTYIYMAFAENPFVTSTGVPTTAR